MTNVDTLSLDLRTKKRINGISISAMRERVNMLELKAFIAFLNRI